MTDSETPTIGQIYPEYTSNELAEADETIKRYVHLVWRIYKRLKQKETKKI